MEKEWKDAKRGRTETEREATEMTGELNLPKIT